MTVPTPAVMAKPRPRPHIDRRDVLLAAIRTRGGTWTTGRVKALYRTAIPGHTYRSNIRGDLRALRDAGYLEQHLDEGGHRYYTLRAVCRCDEPGADPYACEAEPQDCTGHFSELSPHGPLPADVRSAEVSRVCPVCGWRTSTWHVDDGSAEAELHDHVVRLHGGRYEKASTTG